MKSRLRPVLGQKSLSWTTRKEAACCNRFPPVTNQNSLRYPRDLAPFKKNIQLEKVPCMVQKVASAFGAIKACGIDRSCGVKEER